MTLEVLMFGATGQVAREEFRLAGPNLRITTLDRTQADLANSYQCAAHIAAADADVILNSATYSAVDRAQDERDLAFEINAKALGAMARAAADRGLPFLHISTDYVYDGRGKTPHRKCGAAAPIGVYGASKLACGIAITEAGGALTILRTSWVFSAHGANFVNRMRAISIDQYSVSVVKDQRGCPTEARDLAAALIAIAQRLERGSGTNGVFHFAGAPLVSRREFAEAIFQGRPVPKIIPITTEEYPTPAIQPLNSVLDCSKIQQTCGLSNPDWRRSLQNVVKELEQHE